MLPNSMNLLCLFILSTLASADSFQDRVAAHVAHKLHKRDTLSPFPSSGVYLGAWLNGQQGFSDTPAAMNARMNLSLPIYQFGQAIPLAPYDYVAGVGWDALTYLVDYTNTNAAYFLTIYADNGIDAVTDGDLVALGNQLAGYAAAGRTAYLRFLPEMQGHWMQYGQQPTAFKALWQRMYTIVKELAPDCIVVWSPNLSIGYDYGQSLSQIVSRQDRRALDTNHDGQLNNEDDAFAPYFPGPEYVDANGISIYYKGPNYQDINQPQVPGFCGFTLDGYDPYTGTQYTPFYQTYCVEMNKPCIISEIGAAYHIWDEYHSTQLEMQEAFWNDCITNATFLDAYSQIKVINIFEQEKSEGVVNYPYTDLRDYRITNVSEIAVSFRAALEGMGDRFVYASPTSVVATGTAMPTTNPVLIGTQMMTATVQGLNEVVTWTQTSYSVPTPTIPSDLVQVSPTISVAQAIKSQTSDAVVGFFPTNLLVAICFACLALISLLK